MARKRSELTAVIGADSSGFSKGVKSLAGKAKVAAGAVAAAFAAVVAVGAGTWKFAQWLGETEKGMAEVGTIAGVTKDRLRELEDGVFALGAEFGNTTQDSIKGMYDALSAGVPADNVLSFLAEASELAIAGVSDVGTAVDVLTSVLNAYQLPATEAKTVSDQLFAAVKNGKTTLTELAPVVSRVTPLAAAMGVSFAEVAAAFATVTANGIKTAEASTMIRSLLTELSKPGKDLAAAMGELAAQYGEAEVNSWSLQETLRKLRGVAEANGKEFNTLFGSTEAASAALAMTGQNAERARTHLDAVRGSANSVSTAANSMADTLDNKTARAMGAFRQILNELGRDALPFVVAGVEKLIAWLQKLRSDGTLADWAIGITSALGSLILDGQKVVSFLQNVVGAKWAQVYKGILFGVQLLKTTAVATATTIAVAVESLFNQTMQGWSMMYNAIAPQLNSLLNGLAKFTGIHMPQLPEASAPSIDLSKGLQEMMEGEWKELKRQGRDINEFGADAAERHRENMRNIERSEQALDRFVQDWGQKMADNAPAVPRPQAQGGGSPGAEQMGGGAPDAGGAFPDDPMRGGGPDSVPDPMREAPTTPGAQTEQRIAKAFDDIDMIAKKVDKMAGLTGN